jgi:hypothetical protein
LERWVIGLRAFLDDGELDDYGDWNTIEFEANEFGVLSLSLSLSLSLIVSVFHSFLLSLGEVWGR